MCCGGASETITRAQYFRWRSRVQGEVVTWDEDRTCVLALWGPLWASACVLFSSISGLGPSPPWQLCVRPGIFTQGVRCEVDRTSRTKSPATISPDSLMPQG